MAGNPLFNVITTKDGGAFASKVPPSAICTAAAFRIRMRLCRRAEVSDGSSGFVVRRAEAAEQQQPEPAAAEASAATADVPAADAVTPEQPQAAVADRFANNKLFTADKVAAARIAV